MQDRNSTSSAAGWIAALMVGLLATALFALPATAKDGQRGQGKGRMAKWEAEFGFNLTSGNASKDADEDGLKNGREFGKRTNPLSPDTDGDGSGDLDEVKGHSDPTDPADMPEVEDSEAKEEDCETEPVESDDADDPDDEVDDSDEGTEASAGDSASCDSADSGDSVDSEGSADSADSADSEESAEDSDMDGDGEPDGEN